MYSKKTTETVLIDGHELQVELSPGKRRTISMSMERPGIVEIKYPAWAGKRAAMDFLEKKREWVARRTAEAANALAGGFGPGLYDGRMLLYKGRPYRVCFGGNDVGINGNGIAVPGEMAQTEVEEWYRRESERMVGEFIEKNKHDIPDCVIKVKKQKRMWGSCNTGRRIYINSRISMCRPEAVEYVLWHEISHLTYMNHSKDFYRLLESYCPGYELQKAWLKANVPYLRI